MGKKMVQSRAWAKQQLILNAALEVLYTGGPSAITYRAVAGKAGIPVSGVSYYFPTLVELVQAAFAHYFTLLVSKITGNILSGMGESRDLKLLARLFTDEIFARDKPSLLPLYETLLMAARHPELYSAATDAIAQLPRAVTAGLNSMEVPESEVLGPAIIAIIDGFSIRGIQPGNHTPWNREAFQRSLEFLFLGALSGR
ncbi:TetR/AcrR family transcriptional regulator [Arthrobacter russicus]|uniref:DNA-binding transcriptional regulator YbjK n=1 Tax=Arthrobacter russicus TaxID=172040 RepID=A0ABU1J9W6_9MICC|nr:TetR family transcriptional regulator [Arthrobacter russicus]MDN5667854.1 TetR family transcriptional regulator [Renibacterium salmoninarum]MDR6269212.1 DNA-binding transcriptional regulator YbjK [Arthrobacter russicus]